MSDVTLPKIASDDGKNLTRKKENKVTRVKNSQSSARKTGTESVKKLDLDMPSEVHQPTRRHPISKYPLSPIKSKKNVAEKPTKKLHTTEDHAQDEDRGDDYGEDKDIADDQLKHHDLLAHQTAEVNEVAPYTEDEVKTGHSVPEDGGAATGITHSSTSAGTTTMGVSRDYAMLELVKQLVLSLFEQHKMSTTESAHSPQAKKTSFYRLSNDYLSSNTSQKLVDNVDEYMTDIAYVREKLISASVDDHIKSPQDYSLGFGYALN